MARLKFVGYEAGIISLRTYTALCERVASGRLPALHGVRDVYAPDRVISRGHRVVTKDGSVRFGGDTWTAEELKPLAGCAVEVSFVDVHMCSVFVAEMYGNRMLRIDRVCENVDDHEGA